MKELSIEQKAKRYDEVLAWMRDLYPTMGGAMKEDAEHYFPELKESEDERIRGAIIDHLKDSNLIEWAAWLEKQGEQKPVDKVEPKFKVEKDKWYVCTSQYCNCIEGRNYKASSCGRIIDDYGTEYDIHNDAYRWFRPWTIQDAKDGDVLATEDWVFIFKKMNPNKHPTCYCHYDIELGFHIDTNSYIATGSEIHPATKEQRDLLFQEMKEAGYEWDAERLELKKIEQHSAWSEQDERLFQIVIDILDRENHLGHLSHTDLIACVRKLKSLKPQKQWKPSEEQLEALEHSLGDYNIRIFEDRLETLKSLYQDLKKLMER